MEKKYVWKMINYYGTQYANKQEKDENRRSIAVYNIHFGFSIPTEEAVNEIVKFVGDKDVLEAGAGLGLWAYILQLYGVNVRPVDIRKYNDYYHFTKIEYIDGIKAIKKYNPSVLMLVCPDIDSGLSESALKAFKGNKIIYVGGERDMTDEEVSKHIGEDDYIVNYFLHAYPSTGSTEFHDLLEKEWIVHKRITLPNFSGPKYKLLLYNKK